MTPRVDEKKCEDLGRLCNAKLLVSGVRLVVYGFSPCSPPHREGDTREPLFEVRVRRRGKDNIEGEVTHQLDAAVRTS